MKKIALVGNPNVGKSAMFNCLTGSYVAVSNYPGTTVELSRGNVQIGGEEFEIIDTPGMYSLIPVTEEERVARNLLIREKPDCVIHVVDAKNLERMLPLTLQLVEAGFSVLLALNMIDEAKELGIKIRLSQLEKALKIPVVSTVATTQQGIDLLKEEMRKRCLRSS